MTTLEDISTLTQPHHPDDWTELDSRAVDTVRVLAADAVQKVGNGHPGTAMSLAPLAYTLFQRAMRHDPSDVHWLGRDRFVPVKTTNDLLVLRSDVYDVGSDFVLDPVADLVRVQRLAVLLADRLGLVVTGSSDYHGTGKTDHELGCNTTAPDQLDRILELAGVA